MHTEALTATLILLLISVVAVLLFRRIALPAIIAYLGVGIIAGPFGLDLISDSEKHPVDCRIRGGTPAVHAGTGVLATRIFRFW
ncbi:MAG TPA: hypothetical protein ENN02_01835 [Halothiobacillus sp.]|nr:hypothetical protein [Halothiobacillus sp.]